MVQKLFFCYLRLHMRFFFQVHFSKLRRESDMSYTKLAFVQWFYSLQSLFLCPHDATESLEATLQRRKVRCRGDLPKIATSNLWTGFLVTTPRAHRTALVSSKHTHLPFTSWLSNLGRGDPLFMFTFFTYMRDSICSRIQLDFI